MRCETHDTKTEAYIEDLQAVLKIGMVRAQLTDGFLHLALALLTWIRKDGDFWGLTDAAFPSHHHADLFLIVHFNKTDVLAVFIFGVLELRVQKRIRRAGWCCIGCLED